MNFGANEYDNYPEGLEDNTHLRYDGAVVMGWSNSRRITRTWWYLCRTAFAITGLSVFYLCRTKIIR